jgi:hypothetical protein
MPQPTTRDPCTCYGTRVCAADRAWRQQHPPGAGLAWTPDASEARVHDVTCPECGAVFEPTVQQEASQAQGHQIFCCLDHGKRWHDRQWQARRKAARAARSHGAGSSLS